MSGAVSGRMTADEIARVREWCDAYFALLLLRQPTEAERTRLRVLRSDLARTTDDLLDELATVTRERDEALVALGERDIECARLHAEIARRDAQHVADMAMAKAFEDACDEADAEVRARYERSERRER